MSKYEAIAALIRAGKSWQEICLDLEVGKTTVFKVKKLLRAGDDLGRKPIPGRPRTTRAPCAVAGVLLRVRCRPNKPLRRIAEEAGTSKSTVSRIVKESGGRSLGLLKHPLVSKRDQNLTVERCTKLLNNLKSAPPQRITFFSDEKTLTSTRITTHKTTATCGSLRQRRLRGAAKNI